MALLGLLVTRHYGESWDELKFYKYADLSLQAYTTWLSTGELPEFGNTYDNYGPPYVMLVTLGARGLQFLLPWSLSDLRHALSFLTFLFGIWAFYRLARRWLAQLAALGATILFATQPLFWGHAFISPKDIPFLTFFLLALYFGLKRFDEPRSFALTGLVPRTRSTLLVLTALWLASVAVLYMGTTLIHSWIEGTVQAAAAGTPNLVSRLASDLHRVAPEVYVQRYFTFFLRARLIYLLGSAGLLMLRFARSAPAALRVLLSLLPAAIFLGLATSIRILGPLAGLLVMLHATRAYGKKVIPELFGYALLALATMYATWPYLWPDPAGHFFESLRVMSQYPWPGQVLFDGVQYASTDIPYSYLPVLLAVQLTEPVWPLFFIGLVVAILGLVKRREHIELLVLTAIWFVLPLAGFILSRAPLYDNFRQVFFLLPPAFLLAGVAFEQFKTPAARLVLVALVVLPGMLAGLRLHPYEYVYYNSFIGGEAGAFRRFEMDYWGTSYREAANWLNATAPIDARIWVDGPAHLLDLYLREDLQMYSPYESERAEHYEYIVLTTRYDLDLREYSDAQVVHTIGRDGAIFTVIKQP